MSFAKKRLALILIAISLLSLLAVDAFSAQMKVEVIKVYWRDAGEVAQSLSSVVSDDGRLVVDKATNSIIIRDYPSVIEIVKVLMTELDVKPSQIRVTVGFTEKSKLREVGIKVRWVLSNDRGWSVGNIPPPKRGGSYVAVNPYMKLDNMEKASQQTLLLMEGAVGSIFVGREVSYSEALISYGQTHGHISVGRRFKKIGVSFSVVARRTGKRGVRLQITPKISSAEGGGSYAISSASTEVIVKDGETVIIAGNENDKRSFGFILFSQLGSSSSSGNTIMTIKAEVR